MMLLRQRESAEHEEECVALGTKVQSPTLVTRQQKLRGLEEYLLHYIESRKSK